MTTKVPWFEIAGQPADSLRDFYSQLLGWQFEEPAAESLAPAPPSWVARGPRRARTPGVPPWWISFYTRVPDLDEAILKARSLGSRVLVPPTDLPNTTIAVVSDPEGHPLGLCT